MPSLRAAIFGFVLLIALAFGITRCSHVMPRRAPQTAQLPLVVPQVFPDHPDISLPPVSIELPEIFTILADYRIEHVSRLMTFMRFWGLTDPATKTIYINADVSEDSRIETVIHEVLHVIYMRRGYDTRGPYEDLVEARAQEIYHQLYGPPRPIDLGSHCTDSK
jgi:hypothetical protein